MLAFWEAKKAGLFQPKHWLSNIVAGVVALPFAMAFAIASGTKPEQGINTAIVAGFIVSIFGGSRLQIAGPTGAFIVVLSAITAKYGIERLKMALFANHIAGQGRFNARVSH
jgi:SulP family sulfate permease